MTNWQENFISQSVSREQKRANGNVFHVTPLYYTQLEYRQDNNGFTRTRIKPHPMSKLQKILLLFFFAGQSKSRVNA